MKLTSALTTIRYQMFFIIPQHSKVEIGAYWCKIAWLDLVEPCYFTFVTPALCIHRDSRDIKYVFYEVQINESGDWAIEAHETIRRVL